MCPFYIIINHVGSFNGISMTYNKPILKFLLEEEWQQKSIGDILQVKSECSNPGEFTL